MEKPWKNAEGYADPTAYAALKAIEQEEQQRLNILIKRVKYIIDSEGFDLLNRIELKGRTTGREYR